MKLNGKAWMSFAIMLVGAGVAISALRWPFRAALFPMVVGIPLFFLAGLQFYLSGLRRKDHGSVGATVDFKFSEVEDKELAKRRTRNIFLWIVGFFFVILLIGFPIAVPLFVFCYLKFQGKEKWVTSLALTLVAWASFYGLFVKFCDLPFMEGWIQRGLFALGIL